jgi:multiple antibiotic resistance protein
MAVMAVTLVLLLLAQEIHHLIGVTARKVIVRVFGVLLAALAVQSIFNGLSQAHIFD